MTVGWECGVINKYSLSAGKHKPDDKQCIQSTTFKLKNPHKTVDYNILNYRKIIRLCAETEKFSGDTVLKYPS